MCLSALSESPHPMKYECVERKTVVKGFGRRKGNRWYVTKLDMVCVLCIGLPQPAEGPHYGGTGHCTAGHGHSDPSCARPHGGWPPDVDPLDSQNHCRGGTHSTAAGSHPASHCAALQGKRI